MLESFEIMWFRKAINSEEYEKICKKLIDIMQEQNEIKTKLLYLESNFTQLRENYLRKIRGNRAEKDENSENPQQLNSMLIPMP